MPYHPHIAPTILYDDFYRLYTLLVHILASSDYFQSTCQITRYPVSDWCHVDVKDGHFVSNLTICSPVAAAVGRVTDKPMDCHLMIEDPNRWAGDYADAGAFNVT